MIDLTDYLTVFEAAKVIGLHPETLRRLIRQKEAGLKGLDGHKLGNTWYIRRSDLEAYFPSRS